jgi:hypothetical protein
MFNEGSTQHMVISHKNDYAFKKPLWDRYLHTEANVGSSQRRVEIRSESLRILIIIYGPITDNGIWRTRNNNELYMLYNEPDTVEVTKMRILR